MKIQVFGNGGFNKEILNVFTNSVYSAINKLILKIDDEIITDKSLINFFGSYHIEEMASLEPNKHPSLIFTVRKRKEFYEVFKKMGFKFVDLLLVNSLVNADQNDIKPGFFASEALMGVDNVIDENVFIAPFSIVTSNCTIGKSVCILHRTSILNNVEIGDNTLIATNVTINEKIKIGKNCHIGPNQSIVKDIPDNSYVMNNKIIRNYNAKNI